MKYVGGRPSEATILGRAAYRLHLMLHHMEQETGGPADNAGGGTDLFPLYVHGRFGGWSPSDQRGKIWELMGQFTRPL